MVAWFESVVPPEYAPAAMWTTIVIGLLIVLLVVLRLLRGLGSGTFVMGGRNRKARLAVMDATAVDANRRLVLVRRDDVEHLILIGGPTDVVVEQNIRLMAPARAQPEPAAAVVPQSVRQAEPSVEPAPARQPEPQRPATAPAAPQPAVAPRPHPPAPQPVVQRPEPAPPAVMPRPSAQQAPQVAAAPLVAPPTQREAPRPQRSEPIMEPPQPARPAPAAPQPVPAIEPASLDASIAPAPRAEAPRAQPAPMREDDDISLEEEMSRLLGDISAPRR